MKLTNKKYVSTNFITGIRAIAVLLVFFQHSGIGLSDSLKIYNNLAEFIDWGKFGVNIFFVVSGFTIFYQIDHEKYGLRAFLTIRFLRLSIPYYPIIFLFAAYMHYSGDVFNQWITYFKMGEISSVNIFYHLSYLSFIHAQYANTILGVEWTLAIEMFYYICLGLLLTSNAYNGLSLFYKCMIWVLMALLSCNAQWISMHIAKLLIPTPFNDLAFHFMPFKYSYAFLLGGGAYYIRSLLIYETNPYFFNILSNITILTVLSAILLNLKYHIAHDVGVFYASLTFFSLVFVRDNSLFSCIFNHPMMQFIGKISYSFYLWHYFIIHAQLFSFDKITTPGTVLFLQFLLSLCFSFFWYLLFERNIYLQVKAYLLSYRLTKNQAVNVAA